MKAPPVALREIIEREKRINRIKSCREHLLFSNAKISILVVFSFFSRIEK